MRLLRIKFSREILHKLGLELENSLKHIQYAEILEIYQYDNHNIFSKQHIKLKTNKFIPDTKLKSYFEKYFYANFFFLLDRKKNKILCILNQRRIFKGFIPFYQITKKVIWSIIPPISMDSQSIILTILISQEDLRKFIKIYPQSKDFQLLSITKVEGLEGGLGYSGFSVPKFTSRQKNVIKMANKMGYFNVSKRKATGEEVANKLGISSGTFYEHMRKIQKKFVDFYFGQFS